MMDDPRSIMMDHGSPSPTIASHAWNVLQVETLLSALGRSDNAASAMKVLGPHAGKVKQAKEAETWRNAVWVGGGDGGDGWGRQPVVKVK